MKKSIFDDDELYTFYDVVLEFSERVYGGLPRDPELIKAWIEAKGEMPLESLEEKLEVVKPDQAELDLILEEEKVWKGFRSDDIGLFLRDFQVEALIKQCGSTLGIFIAQRGSKGISQHGLFIDPKRIRFYEDILDVGRCMTSPTGYEDVAGHVM